MKRFIKTSVIVLLISGFMGCATAATVEIMKPAEINMGSMKNIAVLYFGYPDLGYGDATIEVIIRNAIGRYLGYGYNRSPEQEDTAKYAMDKFIELLMDTNYFTILDPSNVQGAIVRANKLSLSPAELGDVLGADALLTGSIVYMKTSVKDNQIKHKDKKGNVYYTTEYTKTAELMINYRIVNAKTGQLVATKSFEGSTDSTNSDRYKLPDNRKMYQDVINRILSPLPKQLVPYKVKEYRFLMSDEMKDPEMKQMDELVKKKFYTDARDGYLKIWKSTQNVAAGYNAAIMLEITGDINGAISLMTTVANTTKNETALKEIDRLKKTKKEMEAASSQM